ncbi:MAG: ComEC/Rec2 family competence protein [Acidobacteria bacterium]|nr:ComEC/Rec2 family competence protein [Acidobacteriota bacterium]
MTASIRTSGFTTHPLVWLFSAFAAGIVIGKYTDFSLWPWTVGCGTFALFAFVFRSRTAGTFFLLAAFLFMGTLRSEIESASIADNRLRSIYDNGHIASGQTVGIKGNVAGASEPAFAGRFVIVDAAEIEQAGDARKVSGRVRVFVAARSAEALDDLERLRIRDGSEIRFTCELEREERFLTPGVSSRKEMLDRQGVDAACSVKSPLLLEVSASDGVRNPMEAIHDARLWLMDEVRRKFSPRTAGILIASSLGGKHFLDKPTADIFREGGTFHVLIISGLHITFIGGILLLLVSRFTENRKWQFVITVPLLWAFSLAVGGEPPVVRACLMFTAILFGLAMFRNASPLNSLGLTTLALIVWQPEDLFSPSFQLTCASMLGIVIFAMPMIERLRSIGNWMPTSERPFPPNTSAGLSTFCETLYWNEAAWEIESKRNVWSARLFKHPLRNKYLTYSMRRLLAYVTEVLIVSVSVQILLLPFLIVYFHRIPIASLILNIWVGVLLALESFTAVAAILIGSVADILSIPFVELTELLNRLMLWSSAAMVEGPLASMRVPIYSGAGRIFYFIYFIPALVLAWLLYRWDIFAIESGRLWSRLRTAGLLSAVSLMIVGAVIAFHPFSSPAPDGKLTVEFLDVGQGDATFITFPDGRTMLVDGGGRVNFSSNDQTEQFVPDNMTIGESVVSEFLWERGYSSVDMLVATHADTDHEQGLVDVARNFDISAAYLSSVHGEGDHTRELKDVLAKKRVPIVELGSGEWFDVGGVSVEVIYPPYDMSTEAMSRNDRSLVIRLTYGRRSFLLTGDIEAASEKAIIAFAGSLTADVVKVPHHGSRTSSTREFISKAAPSISVISAGRRSMFGHPHPETIRTLTEYGSKIVTTGQDGTITVSTDGDELFVSTFRSDLPVLLQLR